MSEKTRLGAATTRAEALGLLTETLRRAGVADAAREARLTLRAACNASAADLLRDPDRALADDAARVAEFAARRTTGEPLSRILGRREFWGLDLVVTPDVLDPRPDTETLIEAALARLAARRGEALRILDLGVGSGAILCALLHAFVAARGLGVDAAPRAADVASANVERLGLAARAEIRVGDWTRGTVGPFDLVVSNPPYIRSGDIAGLPREVRDFDPRLALDGGPDGLAAYRILVPAAAALLAPSGWLLLEIGAGQEAEVLALAAASGFACRETVADLAGRTRVVAARL